MAAGLFNSVIHCIGARGGGGDEPGQGDLFKLLSILSVFAAMILFYLSERFGGGGVVSLAKVNVNVTFLSC